MSTTPIYNSIELVRKAIKPALAALSGGRGVHWLEAPSSAIRPFVVIQSQDQGGVAEPHLDALGWSGLITVKVLADATTSAGGNAEVAAETLLAAVAPGMDAITAPVGYDISIAYSRALVLPPLDGVWQLGHIWRVSLERE